MIRLMQIKGIRAKVLFELLLRRDAGVIDYGAATAAINKWVYDRRETD